MRNNVVCIVPVRSTDLACFRTQTVDRVPRPEEPPAAPARARRGSAAPGLHPRSPGPDGPGARALPSGGSIPSHKTRERQPSARVPARKQWERPGRPRAHSALAWAAKSKKKGWTHKESRTGTGLSSTQAPSYLQMFQLSLGIYIRSERLGAS